MLNDEVILQQDIIKDDAESALFNLRFFEIALFLNVFYSLMNLTPMPNTYIVIKVINELAMVLCSGYFILIWITCYRISKLEKIIGGIVILLASVLLLRFHYRILPEICLLFAVRISLSFDYILKKLISYGIIVFLFIALCSILGISNDSTFVRDNMEGVDDVFVAHSFGFFYYSASAYLFMNIIICKMYLCRNDCSWLKLFGFLIASFFVFSLSVTRVQLIVNVLMIVTFVLTYKYKRLNFSSKFWKGVALFSFPLIAYLTCSFFANEELVIGDDLLVLDLFLNGRLGLNQQAFELYGVTPFGNMVETSMGTLVDDYFFIDCGYIDILIRYGYVITAFILVIFSIAFYKIYISKDYFLFFWMLLFLFVSFVNNFFFVVSFFPLPLLIGCFMNSNGNVKTEVSTFNYE